MAQLPWNNKVSLIGRLAKPVKRFENDKTINYRVTIAVDRDFEPYEPDYLELVAFATKGSKPFDAIERTYGNLNQGDLVSVDAKLRQNKYEKNGSTVYETQTVIMGIRALEPKGVRDARKNKAAEPAEAPATQAPIDVPAPAAEVVDASTIDVDIF
jgi:single-stranded DNA-binding protein